MSHRHTQTTKDTTDSSSSAATSKEGATLEGKTGPIDLMEGYYTAHSMYKRESRHGSPTPVVVTPKIYDLLTEGDTVSPLFWDEGVPVLDASREKLGVEALGCKKTIATVIVGS